MIFPKNPLCKPGDRFGRLTVVGVPVCIKTKNGNSGYTKRQFVICKCQCGNSNLFMVSNLKNGDTKSCGCLKTIHKMANHHLYTVWQNMITRCENTNDKSYTNYGGRGISVCKEWHTAKTFLDWALPKWQPGLMIDRIDNSGNYEPSNCRFITRRDNNRNKRTTQLTKNKVEQIHYLHKQGIPNIKIAEIFTIRSDNVCGILKGKTWKDVYYEINI